jgi:hypothetical protein
LTTAVRFAVTTRFKMDCLLKATRANWKYRVAGLVGTLVDLKALTTER